VLSAETRLEGETRLLDGVSVYFCAGGRSISANTIPQPRNPILLASTVYRMLSATKRVKHWRALRLTTILTRQRAMKVGLIRYHCAD
jgi:hypothetical protein